MMPSELERRIRKMDKPSRTVVSVAGGISKKYGIPIKTVITYLGAGRRGHGSFSEYSLHLKFGLNKITDKLTARSRAYKELNEKLNDYFEKIEMRGLANQISLDAAYLKLRAEYDPLKQLIEKEEKERFDKCLRGLSRQEQEIIDERFIEEKTLAEIAKKRDISRQTAHYILNSALRKIRREIFRNYPEYSFGRLNIKNLAH
jgi:RNA polymerase sigma factor (sigma-70 family)